VAPEDRGSACKTGALPSPGTTPGGPASVGRSCASNGRWLQDLRLRHLQLDALKKKLVTLREPSRQLTDRTSQNGPPLKETAALRTNPSCLDAGDDQLRAPTTPSDSEGVERSGEELGVDAGEFAHSDGDALHRYGPPGLGMNAHLIE